MKNINKLIEELAAGKIVQAKAEAEEKESAAVDLNDALRDARTKIFKAFIELAIELKNGGKLSAATVRTEQGLGGANHVFSFWWEGRGSFTLETHGRNISTAIVYNSHNGTLKNMSFEQAYVAVIDHVATLIAQDVHGNGVGSPCADIPTVLHPKAEWSDIVCHRKLEGSMR